MNVKFPPPPPIENEIILDDVVNDSFPPFTMRSYNDEDNIHKRIYVCSIYLPPNNKFEKILKKYDLYDNGYTWEAIVIQILEKENKKLLKTIDFDSDNNECYMYFKNDKKMREVAMCIHNVCKDTILFNKYLKNIDKNRIN
jgi:hypothetical protein